MKDMNEAFLTYRLKPHWIQYAIDQLPWIIIWVIVTLYAGDDTLPYREYLTYGSVCMMCYLIWQAIELWRIEYVITGEQPSTSMACCFIRLTIWNCTVLWIIRKAVLQCNN